MKSLFAFLALSVTSFASAAAQLIVRVPAGSDPYLLEALYPLQVQDVSAHGPFALVFVTATDHYAVRDLMVLNGHILWGEDNAEINTPETIGASKGGTVAAIFNLGNAYSHNDNLLNQIKWQIRGPRPTDRFVRVGILDTGIPATMLDIRVRTVAMAGFAPDRADAFDRPSGVDTNGNGKIDEALGHGSMVTGLVMQTAPYARFVVARVADADGVATSWSVVKGIAFCVANGVELINCSLGSPESPFALSHMDEYMADENGVLGIAAAGNNNLEGGHYPSRYRHFMMVTGVDDQDNKAAFSNWDGQAVQAAPATGVNSLWWDGRIAWGDGTSYAAPLVTGCVADQLRSVPRQTPDFIRDVLRSTGDDIDPLNQQYQGKLGLRLNWLKLKQAFGVN